MFKVYKYFGKQWMTGDGFTLSEIMIAMAIFALVIGGAVPTYIMCLRTSTRASVDIRAAQEASFALQRIVYGVGDQYGLRSAVAATVTGVPSTGDTWRVSYSDIAGWSNSFAYNGSGDYLTYYNADFPSGVNIGHCIVAASVTNMASNLGIGISVTCCATDGKYFSSNTMTTCVRWRN